MDFKLPTESSDDLIPSFGDKQTKTSSAGLVPPTPPVHSMSSVDPKQSTKNKYEPVVPVKPMTIGGGRKGLSIAIGILVVILLAGAGAFAYFYYIGNTPEMIIGEAIINMAELDSVSYKANVDMSVEIVKTDNMLLAAAGQSQNIKLSIDSRVDNRDVIQANGSVELSLDGGIIGTSSEGAQAELSFINLEDEVYLKLASLSLPSELASMLPLDLENIYNKWVKVDSIKESSKFEIDDLNKFANLDDDETKIVYDIYRQHQFMNVLSSTNDGDLKRFELQIDGDALFEMAKEVNQVIYKEESFDYDDISQEVIDQMSNIEIVIWIGAKDKMIHKIHVLFDEEVNIDEDNVIGININLTAEYSNFNEGFDITVPTDFITSEQLIEEVTASMMADVNTTNPPGMTEDKDTDGDGISNWLEISLGMDPMGLDSDGDGFSDEDEMRDGFNPMGTGRLWEVSWNADQKRNVLFEIGGRSMDGLNILTDQEVEDLYTTILKGNFEDEM